MAPDPSPTSRLSADIDRTLRELNRSFDPLKKDFPFDFHVAASRDGYVCLSVVMPEGMTRVFMTLLRSLHGFFRQIDLKASYASSRSRPLDPEVIEKQRQMQEDYRQSVCSLFDGFIDQGHTRNQAISMANSALKELNHPWATYDLVSSTLRSEGRFRKKKPGRKD